MKKLIAAIVAAALMPVSTVFGASWRSDAEITGLLSQLNIMVGDDQGNFNLDMNVSRAEMAKIAIASSSAKNTVALGLSFSPFSDVKGSFWGAPYIQAAVEAGLVDGYIDGTFKPNGTVTYEEAITMMLKVLGYSNDDFGASYPYGQVGTAESLNMTTGMDSYIGQPLTRRQVAMLVSNTLDTKQKNSSSDLIAVHDCSVIEDVTIIASASDDPTLSSDEISTTSGIYRTTGNFDDMYVGSRGDMVVKNGKYFVAFASDGELASEKYVIYSILNDAILAYPAGNNTNLKEFSVSATTTCYKNSTAYIYSSLRGSMEMGDIIRIRYNDSGEIDYINYSEGTLTGPVKITSDDWMSGFDSNSGTKIMRDGTKVSAGDIKTNDIVYFCDALNMVLAYSKKVTGVYESASPSKDSPQTVTVSGVTYDIEGKDAFDALSSSGGISYGDTVTLLMGRDGEKIAGVATQAASETVVGYVTGSGKKTFLNSDGTTYSSYYIDLVTTSGAEYTYPTQHDRSSAVNTVARVRFEGGSASVSTVNGTSALTGYVDASALTIGGRKVAQDAQMIDVAKLASIDTAVYAKTYLRRIDGITLKSDNVAYFATNSAGEIDRIILQNVTGDMYKYGIVTSKTDTSFTIQADSATYTAGNFSLMTGSPVQFIADGATAVYASTIKQIGGTETALTQSSVMLSGKKYKLSDKVRVFKKQGTKYLEMSLNDAISGSYDRSFYHDKDETQGGRVRVIICKDN